MSPTRAPGLPPADPLADEAALAGWDDLTDGELRALMPDPGGGPPENAAGAWLAGLLTGDAGLPDDAGLMPAGRGLSPGVQEAGAGEPASTWLESLFPHCTPDGPGLSASAVLGVLAPGVALAGFTVDASGRLAQISESELIGVLRAWRRRNSCQHPLQTTAYRPPSLARHLVQVRHPAWTFPGCRHPATRCDLDHTVPCDQGGRTCSCNLAPLCRLCRPRHKLHYADVLVMPMSWPEPLVAAGLVAGRSA